MKTIRDKINLITDIWNSFILEEKFFQDKINFSDEVGTNYYGEIMHYLNDTFTALDNHEKMDSQKGEFHDFIFYIIGILQVMYVQQDLVDEMMRIFKLAESNSSEKKSIRKLRNELVGHPICRDKMKKLISSAFWGGDISYNCINYIKYQKGSMTNSESKKISIKELIDKHKIYLNYYFNQILKQERKILKEYKTKLLQLQNILSKLEPDYHLIIKLSNDYIERIHMYSMYFSKEIVMKGLEKINDGERYKNFIDCYYNFVKESVFELLESTQEYLEKIDGKYIENMKDNNIEINIIDDICEYETIDFDDELEYQSYINDSNSKNKYSYYLSKLSERKYTECIDILIKENQSNGVIVKELKNMKLNIDDDLEYYCSYLLVSKLLLE